MNITFCTSRLVIRPYCLDDLHSLHQILGDAETMLHYPAPFTLDKSRTWILWNLDNYEKYGFGLWVLELKSTGKLIGDCGITLQNIDSLLLPEIGYHINKNYWRQGLATEAALAVRDWAFQKTSYDIIYACMKFTNVPSKRTAQAIGMRKLKEFADPLNTTSYLYGTTRQEWKEHRI